MRPKQKLNACILDNGASTAKIGLTSDDEPQVVPNCIMKAKSERRRPFIGKQIDECRDASGLFYILCFQRGYLVNWDIQKTVWDHMFQEVCPVNFNDAPLILTEPQFNFPSIQEAMTEIFFEEYECELLYRTTSADLCAVKYLAEKNPQPLCCVIVDLGYSFCHVVPFIKGKKFKEAIRRIDIGGKILSNHLKELLSYRQLNVMDEGYVINQAKEDGCFVSLDFKADMRLAQTKFPQNTIVKNYVLPDFTTIPRGLLRSPDTKLDFDEQQMLKMNNERFAIPELLFHPSDVGIRQMGVHEAIADAIKLCPEETIPHLYANIIIVGGSALFPNMQQRLQNELRAMAPEDADVNVQLADDPVSYAWHGGVELSREPNFEELCMTREQYEDEGVRGGLDRFDI